MNQSLTIFTVLVQQYHPILYRFARCIIKNEQEADAIAAKALVQCWNKKEELLTATDIHNFLKTTTRTLCHQWLQEQALAIRQQQYRTQPPFSSSKGPG